MSSPYVELHAASAFSFLEAASSPEALIDRAAALGYPALALLDRDGVYGAPRFHMAAKQAGLRAIIGAELTIRANGAPSSPHPPFLWRLPVLVESRDGYRGLCRLITRMKMSAPKGEGALRLEDLEPGARLVSHSFKRHGMVEGLDDSFDAVVFIGYHAKAGTPTGLFARTGSGVVADLRVNGRSVGEGGLNTLAAQWYGVPVVVVTGDDVAVAQVAEVATGVRTVATKRAINQRAVELFPDRSRLLSRFDRICHRHVLRIAAHRKTLDLHDAAEDLVLRLYAERFADRAERLLHLLLVHRGEGGDHDEERHEQAHEVGEGDVPAVAAAMGFGFFPLGHYAASSSSSFKSKSFAGASTSGRGTWK